MGFDDDLCVAMFVERGFEHVIEDARHACAERDREVSCRLVDHEHTRSVFGSKRTNRRVVVLGEPFAPHERHRTLRAFFHERRGLGLRREAPFDGRRHRGIVMDSDLVDDDRERRISCDAGRKRAQKAVFERVERDAIQSRVGLGWDRAPLATPTDDRVDPLPSQGMKHDFARAEQGMNVRDSRDATRPNADASADAASAHDSRTCLTRSRSSAVSTPCGGASSITVT